MLSHNCFSVTRKTRPLFSNVLKINKCKPDSVRCFFKIKKDKSNEVQGEKERTPLTGYDDPRYSDVLIEHMRSFESQKESFRNFIKHCKQLREETRENLENLFNFDLKDDRKKINILHKFEKPEDLKGFSVLTDSSHNTGYSSASLKLTDYETAIFSGNLCLDAPKGGATVSPGYANLRFPKQKLSFFRVKPYYFSEYTHMVFKIRGDGRTYLVFLHCPYNYKEIKHTMLTHQLYTRGGPYWQIVKIPLYHFWISLNGKIFNLQSSKIPLDDVHNISITATGYEGPFKLEIDYIGVEFMKYEKMVTPYERYRI